MTRAIIAAFHKYQPYGGQYYEPILDYFLKNLTKYKDEFDTLYLVDSTWNIDRALPSWIKVIKVNPHLRYYDAYKEVLPQVKEDLVLFMDDDMVVYKPGRIAATFEILSTEPFDTQVVSIYDTIGERRDNRLHGKSKFCPYWFATSKEELMKFLGSEWGPVPWGETLSELTMDMLAAGNNPYEWPEDKSSLNFDGSTQYDAHHIESGRGYYHIRSGSVPALLLAYKYNDTDKYFDYINNQPRNEYLRQLAWYHIMLSSTMNETINHEFMQMLGDLKITPQQWMTYMNKFMDYHGLADTT